MPGDVYRCIGYVKMYYIRGRTKPEDKFVLRHESSHELSCLAPSEIYRRGLKVINLWITNEGRTVRCRDCAIDRLPQYDLHGCCASTVPTVLISGYSKFDKVFTLITAGGNDVLMPENELLAAMKSTSIVVSNATITSKGLLRLTCTDTITYTDTSGDAISNNWLDAVTKTMCNTAIVSAADNFNLKSIFAMFLPSDVINKQIPVKDMIAAANLTRDKHLDMVDAVSSAIHNRLKLTAVVLSSHGIKVSLHVLMAKSESGRVPDISNGVDYYAIFVASVSNVQRTLGIDLSVDSEFNLYITDIKERNSDQLSRNVLPLYFQPVDINAGEYYLEGTETQPDWLMILRKTVLLYGKTSTQNGEFWHMSLESFENALRSFASFGIRRHPDMLSKVESAAGEFVHNLERVLVHSINGLLVNTSVYHVARVSGIDSYAAFVTYSDKAEAEYTVAGVLFAVNSKNGTISVLDTLGFNQCDEFAFSVSDCHLDDFARTRNICSITKASHIVLLNLRKIKGFKAYNRWNALLKSCVPATK